MEQTADQLADIVLAATQGDALEASVFLVGGVVKIADRLEAQGVDATSLITYIRDLLSELLDEASDSN